MHIGEVLLVKPEPTNDKDTNAVAVLKENVTVGHVPQNLAQRLFHFLLRRDVNKAFAEVTGPKVNREVIKMFEKHKMNQRSLAEQFQCGRTQIAQIIKNKVSIMSLYESNASGSKIHSSKVCRVS